MCVSCLVRVHLFVNVCILFSACAILYVPNIVRVQFFVYLCALHSVCVRFYCVFVYLIGCVH